MSNIESQGGGAIDFSVETEKEETKSNIFLVLDRIQEKLKNRELSLLDIDELGREIKSSGLNLDDYLKTLNFLEERYDEGLTYEKARELDFDLDDDYLEFLPNGLVAKVSEVFKVIIDKTDNYFIGRKITSIVNIEDNLNDITIEQNRQFLKDNWRYIKDNWIDFVPTGDISRVELDLLTPEQVEQISEKLYLEMGYVGAERVLVRQELLKKWKLEDDDLENFWDKNKTKTEKPYFQAQHQTDNFILLSPDIISVADEKGGVVSLIEIDDENELHLTSVKELLAKAGYVGQTGSDEAERKYLALVKPEMRALVEKELGVNIGELDIRTQFQLLNFLASKTSIEMFEVNNFSKKFGINGLKTFLACEQDPELGDKITRFGEVTESEIAVEVFKKYAELADLADRGLDLLQEVVDDDKQYDASIVQEIKNNLLYRAHKLLQGVVSENDEEKLNTKIDELLALQPNTLALAEVFRNLYLKKEITLTEMKGMVIDEVRGGEIADVDRAQMVRIAQTNWSAYPTLTETVVKGFSQALSPDSESQFHLVRYGGRVIAFIRFDERGDHTFYMGSINVDPSVRGFRIGDAMMKLKIDEYAEKGVIDATAYHRLPVLAHYIGDLGFTADGLIDNYESTGETFFRIVRDDKKAWRLGRESLPELKQLVAQTEENISLLVFSGDELLAEHLDLIRQKFQAGYHLTRYLKDQAEGKMYLAFERE